MDQLTKLEQLRAFLETLSGNVGDIKGKMGYADPLNPLQTQSSLLNEILNAIPGGGNYALESSLQTAITTLQSLLTCCEQRGTEATLQAIQGSIPSTSELALDATLQSLLTCCNARGTEATLQAIQGSIPSTSGLALDATLQSLLSCCNARGTEATLQAIQEAIPSVSGLALEATLQSLLACCAAQAADIAAIKGCTCKSPLLQMMDECCQTEVEENGERKSRSMRDAENGVDFHEDDPAYAPPDGSADWSAYKTPKCRWARYFTWETGRNFEDLINLYQKIGDAAFNMLSSTSVISTVQKGAVSASAAVVATRAGLTLAKGVAGGTAIGLIAVAVYEALVVAWKVVFDLYLDVVMSLWNGIPSCELVNAIYCGKTGQEVKDNWDAVIDAYVPAIPHAPVALVFRLWMSQDTANALLAIGSAMEAPDVLTECACNCMSDWHDPDLAVHTHDDLRSMTLSGNVITQWTNTGAAGGYFSPFGSPVFDSGYVTIAPNKKLCWAQGGRFWALYVVCEFTGTAYNNYVLSQAGQDTAKPLIYRTSASNVQLTLVGGDYKNLSVPTGKCLIGMRYVNGENQTYFSLNGSPIGTAAGSGSPGITPPFCLGSNSSQYSTNCRIWAVVGWLYPNPLTEDQEDDIINNLTTLYGPFGV